MASIYRPTRPEPIPPDAEIVLHKGKRCAKYRNRRGKWDYAPLTRDGGRMLVRQRNYVIEFTDVSGQRHRVTAFADKGASEQRAAQLERDAERGAVGLVDPYQQHTRRPLADHLADYRRHLDGEGRNARYVGALASRLTTLFAACKFRTVADFNATRVSEYLAGRRADAAPTDVPERESFTKAEACAGLGMKKPAFSKAVAVHALTAAGNGRARRYPRATVLALAERRSTGNGTATTNQILIHFKAFARWLVRERRLATQPFGNLSGGNADADRRHRRGELTEAELQRLFSTARTQPPAQTLTGEQRAMLYAVAYASAFRARALASLTPESFDLSAAVPTVSVAARYAKNGQRHTVPLPAWTVELLRPYLATINAGKRLWPGRWCQDCEAGAMLKRDLRAAGIPYTTEGPDGTEYRDFHSLRHSCPTHLGRAGADLRTIQLFADHSDLRLTARYSHRTLHDLAGAAGRLPSMVASNPERDEIDTVPLRLTGTDHATAELLPASTPGFHVGQHVGTVCTEGHLVASTGTLNVVTPAEANRRNSLNDKPDGTLRHHPAAIDTSTPSRSRTYNLRIRSVNGPTPNPLDDSNLQRDDATACTPACTDAELSRIVAAWPTLPVALRAAILAIIKSADR